MCLYPARFKFPKGYSIEKGGEGVDRKKFRTPLPLPISCSWTPPAPVADSDISLPRKGAQNPLFFRITEPPSPAYFFPAASPPFLMEYNMCM